MVAERKYYDYEYTTAAKELEELNKRKKVVVKKQKVKAKSVMYIISIFIMFMAVVYRTNVISEKNMKVIKLRNKLESVEANLSYTKIKLEQNTDTKEIESYAKQKLGMQKPDKSQIIYIDSSTQSSLIVNEETTFLDKVLNRAKEFIKKIF